MNDALDRAAHDAVERGRAALRAGERTEALRWLDRAHRLAPGDRSVALLLASAFTGVDAPHGRTLLRDLVAAAPDMRDARVALVLSELGLGGAAEAARQLGRLLMGMAPPPDAGFARVAGAVARAARAPGWIGADSRGLLLVCAEPVPGASDGSKSHGTRPVRVEIAVNGVRVDGIVADGIVRNRALAAGRTGVMTATCGGLALLGSGVDLAALRRTRGTAWLEPDGSLTGWAWLPGDPDRGPFLEVHGQGAAGASRPIRLRAVAEHGGGNGAERRRGFRVTAQRLSGADTIRVMGPDGRELTGSPLSGRAERQAGQAAAAALGQATSGREASLRVADNAPPASVDLWRPLPAGLGMPPEGRAATAGGISATARAIPARRPVDVVMPVHRGEADFTACLATLLRDRAARRQPAELRIVVVDDASPDPALRGAVAAAEARGDIVLLRHANNRGFPGAANTGLRHARTDGPRDVVLLNPDTLLPTDWLGRMAAAAYGAADVGSVTPMTDDGSILSYAADNASGDAEVQDLAQGMARLDRIDSMFRAANGDRVVALPTGIGFCMLLRHDCLAEVGLLREDVFAQGYGEENDWCLRAGHLGWRHVAATGVFVAHRGGRSFGPARAHLMARNMALLNRLHPGYDTLVARFEAADPLAPARRRVDRLRWAAGRRAGAVVLVTHALGGGVERHLRERVAAIRDDGLRAVVLRPAAAGQEPAAGTDRTEAASREKACAVSDGVDGRFADLGFAMPTEMAALARLLRGDGVRRVELHHLLGHAPEISGLAEMLEVPCDVVVHDYAAWCPRVSLCGANRRYCGEPVDQLTCEDCVADLGSRLDERIGVAALRARSGRMLRTARRVVAPSADAAERIARQFPGVAAVVAPWEDDARPPHDLGRDRGGAARGSAAGVRILVMGAIGVEKGYDVLLGCVRDAGRRGLPMDFVVAGHTMDDARLIEAGPVFVTGRYEEHEAVVLARRQGAQFGFVPSVWPETWCYALSELWRAGLDVAAFALGAQAERIRNAGHGLLLPPGLPAGQVNDALLRAALDAGRTERQMAGAG
ncbi:MAG: glycosyltransferase [Janthinobacterium lividum]